MDGVTHEVGKWELLIAHPPCTYLSNVATRSFGLKCTPPEKVCARWSERGKAAVFFVRFALADIPRIAVENPVGFINTAYRKPDQIIHPYMFAESVDDAENYHEKRTCLWLKGLPLLRTNDFPTPPPMYISQGARPKKIGWCEGMRGISGGQSERAKAMAEQWGDILRNENKEK